MARSRFGDYYQAFPLYREGAGGTAGYGDGNTIATASFSNCVKLEQGRMKQMFDRWDNKGHFGGGTRHANDSAVLKARSEGSFNGPADVDFLAWLLGITMGDLVTTTPVGATLARKHTFTEMDPADGLQLPSSELMTQSHDAIGYQQWIGLVGDNIKIAGGRDQWVTFNATVKGNGRVVDGGAYTPVGVRVPRKLRDALSTVKFGAPGSLVDYTGEIVKWEFSFANELTYNYQPRGVNGLLDVADRGSAMVADSIDSGTPTIDVSLTVFMEDDAPRNAQAANSAREIEIVAEGAEIESGHNDKLRISLKDVRFTEVEEVEHEGKTAWQLKAMAQFPASGSYADMCTVEVTNSAVGILAIPA